MAIATDAFRAAAKSSHHVNSPMRAPRALAIATVSSTLPVSTTITSSTHGMALSRHRANIDASSRTIMHSEIRWPAGVDAHARVRPSELGPP